MPKDTFLNLPQDRRDLIINASIEEFARNPFENASLRKIVAITAIAKGSMYQYFKDKKELYIYVLNLAYERKRQYVASAFFTKRGDFFELVKEYYVQTYRFAQEHPLLHSVIHNFWESRDSAVREEILKERSVRISDFEEVLSQGMASGQIREGIDYEATYFVYHAVGKELIENFLHDSTLQDQNVDFIARVLGIIKHGIVAHKPSK
ncbi:MAG: TetR/AcrR family transcriptional regulator [Bacillota bacterium]|nr:TetR/AcrR family transcriptional regulator [Bacillota bacterium]